MIGSELNNYSFNRQKFTYYIYFHTVYWYVLEQTRNVEKNHEKIGYYKYYEAKIFQVPRTFSYRVS